jgi:hypothetical protein
LVNEALDDHATAAPLAPMVTDWEAGKFDAGSWPLSKPPAPDPPAPPEQGVPLVHW